MKKIIALTLAAIMIFGCLTGCTTAEKNYLDMSIKTTEKAFEGESKITAEFGDFFSAMYGIKEMTAEGTYIVDAQNNYMSMTFDMAMGDYKFPSPITMVADGNNMYISKDAFIDGIGFAVELATAIYGPEIMTGDSLGMPEGYLELLEEKLADYTYIAMYDEDMIEAFAGSSFSDEDLAMVEEIYTIIYDYLIDIFSGFETGIITQSGDTFTLHIDAKKACALIKDAIDYLYENKSDIYDKTADMIIACYDIIPDFYAQMETSREDVIVAAKEAKEQIMADCDEMYADFEGFDTSEFERILAGTYIDSKISETAKGYDEFAKVYVQLDLSDAFGVKAEETGALSGYPKQPMEILTMQADSEIHMIDRYEKIAVDTAKTLTATEINDMMYAITYELNPANYMEIDWRTDVEYWSNSVNITMVREDGNTAYEYADYDMTIEEGRIYLPMRQICEWFGEDVQWDNVGKRALVIRDDKEFDLTGTIINDRTFIKVRDFEKLGYTIDYVQENGVNTATITKN